MLIVAENQTLLLTNPLPTRFAGELLEPLHSWLSEYSELTGGVSGHGGTGRGKCGLLLLPQSAGARAGLLCEPQGGREIQVRLDLRLIGAVIRLHSKTI